jgi:hypothetical protein
VSEHRGECHCPRRVTIAEASSILGISKDAVGMRVKRDTLRSEKDEDGRVSVYLNDVPDVDAVPNAGVSGALVEELLDRVRFLEDQLQQANERDRENRRIVAALTSRIPELEAPQERPEGSETVEEEPEAEPRSASVEAQEELSARRARREMAETTLHEGMAEERRRREEAERERDELRQELYARRGRTEASETAEEQQGRGQQQPRSDASGPQGGARRPWWRRVLRR